MAALRLLRPGNLVLSLVAVALGGVLARGGAAFAPGVLPSLLLAMASAALIGSGANALNDAADAEIDRVNRPGRPVPSGAVSVRRARQLGVACSVLGVLLGGLVSVLLATIAAGSFALLAVYNRWLKGTPGPGNVAVALVIAAAPLYGALAVEHVAPAVWAAVGLTFLVTLAREVAKDVEDVVGDAAGGARTLAVAWGESRAAWTSVGVVTLTVALMPAPILWGVSPSFLVYGLGAAACLLTAAWGLAMGAGESPPRVRAAASRARAWLKAAMVTGVAALLLARLG